MRCGCSRPAKKLSRILRLAWNVGGGSEGSPKVFVGGVGGEQLVAVVWNVGGCVETFIERGCAEGCGNCTLNESGSFREVGFIVVGLGRFTGGESCVFVGCVAVVSMDINFSRLLSWATGSACEDFFA